MGLRCGCRSPACVKRRSPMCKATARENDEQMEHVRTRLLELRHHLQHRWAYKKRTEMVVEIVAPLEQEGQFPAAHYAFDNGVLTVELARVIAPHSTHWVSELA